MAEDTITKTFRFTETLVDELMDRARRQGISLNACVGQLLESALHPDTPDSVADLEVLGYMRLRGLSVDELNLGAYSTFGRAARRKSFEAFRGAGTSDTAWEDLRDSLARNVSFDAQLVLYRPDAPDSPIFAALEAFPHGGYTYLRLRRTTQGGQWCRRRLLTLDIPQELMPETDALRVAETHEP